MGGCRWLDGKMHTIDEKTYALRFTPRRTGSVWSKSNRDRATSLIESGLMTKAGLEKIEEAKKNGMWEKARHETAANTETDRYHARG